MMYRYLRNVVLGMCCLVLVTSCGENPSSPKGPPLLREGTTSGGRAFQVFGEPGSPNTGGLLTEAFTLVIENEADFVIPSCPQDLLEPPDNCPRVFIDSIRVYDLAGSPDLVYVGWKSSGYDSVSDTTQTFYHYAVFPRGIATLTLLKGTGFHSVISAHAYYSGESKYDLTYTDNVVSITEHWKGFAGGLTAQEYGTAEEKIVSRAFAIQSREVTELACEERIRTLSVSAIARELLDIIGWQYRVTSLIDDPDLCAAIEPKRCVLAGICTRGIP